MEKVTFSILYPRGKVLIVLRKKWSLEIIRDMFSGKNRFREFKEGRPDLSNKVLAERLKCLKNKGFIEKKIINSNPFSTEYDLTELGNSLNRFMYELIVFNLENFEKTGSIDLQQIKEYLKETLKMKT